MNNFQTILAAVFLAFFVFAVLIFSGMIKIGDSSSNSTNLKGKVVVWGTLSSPELYKVFESATGDNRDLYISYVKKSSASYQQELIEAFASNKGPDLFFITPDMIIKNQDFFYKVPYENYPEKAYRNSFIDGAEIFLDTEGTIGFPVVVDPMVMYYNKNMLSNEGIAVPPVYWNELFNLSSRLTKTENNGAVKESMIALGRYDNVSHSKEILATFLLQSNNPIVEKEKDGGYVPVLDDNRSSFSLEEILNFLMEFSNPSNLSYSWNRSLPNSTDMFTSGKLAFYLGKASELFKIQSTNPNLSFDVTEMLQTKGATKRTNGDIYAIAVSSRSKNPSMAFSVAGLLSSDEVVQSFSNALSLPPALKSLLSKKPIDPYLYTFSNSAIITRSWVDPNPIATDNIFGELFNNILSNKLEVGSAISRAQDQLEQVIK